MFALTGSPQRLLRQRLSITSLLGTFLDPLVTVVSLAAVCRWHDEDFRAPYFILALIAFSLTFPGKSHLGRTFGAMVRDIVFGWLTLSAVLVFFGYASGYLSIFPREVLTSWFVAAPIGLLVAHQLARVALPRVMAMPANLRSAVIVGANDTGLQLAKTIRGNPYLGTRLVGFFDDRGRSRLGDLTDLPLLGPLKNIATFAKQNQIESIYLALPMATQPRILALLDDLQDTTTSVYFVPDMFVTDLIQARMDDVGGVPVVAVCETPFMGVNGLIKRTSDIVLASLILILVSPLMLATALGVKLTSPGPVLFRQRRYGLDGKEIVVYKFRSMTVMEDGGQVVQATRGDSRVTPFGSFMRKTSLDEIPQFINVLQGRMSIVGPRPHAVAHNELYRKLIKGYMVRHKVKPGITGLAQVNGLRGETDSLEKMQARIDYDLAYLRNWSVKLDIRIILKTIWIVLRGDRHAY